METTKPGWKTTEFWLTVVTTALSVFSPFAAAIGPKTAALIGAASTAVYTAGRAYVKGQASQPNATPSDAPK